MTTKQIIEKLKGLEKYSADIDCGTIGFDKDEHWGDWIKLSDVAELIAELQKTKNEVALVSISSEMFELIMDMYKSGEKLEAVKWLIQESNGSLNIKTAKEFLDSFEC